MNLCNMAKVAIFGHPTVSTFSFLLLQAKLSMHILTNHNPSQKNVYVPKWMLRNSSDKLCIANYEFESKYQKLHASNVLYNCILQKYVVQYCMIILRILFSS